MNLLKEEKRRNGEFGQPSLLIASGHMFHELVYNVKVNCAFLYKVLYYIILCYIILRTWKRVQINVVISFLINLNITCLKLPRELLSKFLSCSTVHYEQLKLPKRILNLMLALKDLLHAGVYPVKTKVKRRLLMVIIYAFN